MHKGIWQIVSMKSKSVFKLIIDVNEHSKL